MEPETSDAKASKPTHGKPNCLEKVEEWLNTQGYPLEYRTYWSLLRRFASQCGLGAHVTSKEGRPREVDVYAYDTYIAPGARYRVHLRLVCECKYSRKKPWVLLYGNTEQSSLLTTWIRTPRSKTLDWLPDFPQERERDVCETLGKTFHFSEGLSLAHSIVQAHSDDCNEEDQASAACKRAKRDQAYSALQKTAHAAWDYIETWEHDLKGRAYDMVFPCLVVDAPLFGAFFDPKTGRIQARELTIGHLCWQGCRNGTNVDVVHASALDEYAEKVRSSFQAIMPVLVGVAENWGLSSSKPLPASG